MYYQLPLMNSSNKLFFGERYRTYTQNTDKIKTRQRTIGSAASVKSDQVNSIGLNEIKKKNEQ